MASSAHHHHAVTAIESHTPPKMSYIHVTDPARVQHFCAANIVLEKRIAAIIRMSPDCIRFESSRTVCHRIARRNHDPRGARRRQLCDEIIERRGANRSFANDLRDRILTVIAIPRSGGRYESAPHHVAAHAAEPDHPELHRDSLRFNRNQSTSGCYDDCFLRASFAAVIQRIQSGSNIFSDVDG